MENILESVRDATLWLGLQLRYHIYEADEKGVFRAIIESESLSDLDSIIGIFEKGYKYGLKRDSKFLKEEVSNL